MTQPLLEASTILKIPPLPKLGTYWPMNGTRLPVHFWSSLITPKAAVRSRSTDVISVNVLTFVNIASARRPGELAILLEKIPPELLETVFAYTPIPDVLRMKQVRRPYHRRVQKFPAESFGHSFLPGQSWFPRFHPGIALYQVPSRSFCLGVGR